MHRPVLLAKKLMSWLAAELMHTKNGPPNDGRREVFLGGGTEAHDIVQAGAEDHHGEDGVELRHGCRKQMSPERQLAKSLCTEAEVVGLSLGPQKPFG